MQITNDVKYVGVNDRITDLFEGQYIIPNGIAYNSYLVIDEKIAVFDSVDARFAKEWLSNIENVLEGRKPDYLIVQHMEPDHSSSIEIFAQRYPDAKIVSSSKSFVMPAVLRTDSHTILSDFSFSDFKFIRKSALNASSSFFVIRLGVNSTSLIVTGKCSFNEHKNDTRS